MKARTNFSVIHGVTSHAKDYIDRFFFVRIDGESVEEGFLHLFPTGWLYQRGKIVASPFLESEKRVPNVCVFFFVQRTGVSRMFLPIFRPRETFLGQCLVPGTPLLLTGFEGRSRFTDRETVRGPVSMMDPTFLPLQGGGGDLGRIKGLLSRPRREMVSCRDTILTSLQRIRVFLPRVTSLMNSLRRFPVTSLWTTRRGTR